MVALSKSVMKICLQGPLCLRSPTPTQHHPLHDGTVNTVSTMRGFHNWGRLMKWSVNLRSPLWSIQKVCHRNEKSMFALIKAPSPTYIIWRITWLGTWLRCFVPSFNQQFVAYLLHFDLVFLWSCDGRYFRGFRSRHLRHLLGALPQTGRGWWPHHAQLTMLLLSSVDLRPSGQRIDDRVPDGRRLSEENRNLCRVGRHQVA